MEPNYTIPQSPPTSSPPSPLPSMPPPANNDKPKGKRFKNAVSTILLLAAAPIIAILLTAFVFQSYEVEGPSMRETLHDGDRLIVLKAPRTWANITGDGYIPKRGDIIVFDRANTSDGKVGSDDKQLIKRVIALPGERITIKDGTITVFNAENPDGFNPDEGTEWSDTIEQTLGNIDMVVPEGKVYVCGDNRMNSADSRIFGPVASEDIVGKLMLRIMPLNQAQSF